MMTSALQGPTLSVLAALERFAAARGLPLWTATLADMLLVTIVLVAIAAGSVMILVYMERKVSADFQDRLGPMRVGPHGTLQLVADTIKIMRKEDIIPACADRTVFKLAPYVIVVPALLAYVVIPFTSTWIARDLSLGLFYFLAIPSVSAVGIIMAGWGSGSKYPWLGGLRSAAQVMSYEIPRALSVLGVVMLAGTLSTVSIVNSQSGIWFIVLQPLGFLVFFISSLAELKRIPFDLPEAESELVAGYFTEYSGMRFMFFMMGEYVAMLAAAAMVTTLFLGGWRGPLLPPIVWFLLKTFAVIFVMMWLRWTLPRFRIDQLMSVSWKFLIPVALLNIVLTGAIILGLDKFLVGL